MNSSSKTESSKKIINVVNVIFFILGIAVLVYRIVRGIDFTDQSWYVAEPYIVSEGAIPYVDNWSHVPGFTIPLATFTKIFTHINGGTEGIFLFSRIEYVIWLIAIGGIVFYLINRSKYKIPSIILLPFLFITPYQLYAINYNTIGLMYLLLSSALLCSDYLVTGKKEIL